MLLWITFIITISTAGYWLNSSDIPESKDVIVILGGDPSRAIEAADLYKNKFATEVWVSQPVQEASTQLLEQLQIPVTSQEEIYKQVLLKKGVPENKIILFGDHSISTLQEAEALSKIMGKKSFLVVTSPYHTFRTRLIFSKYFPKHQFLVVASQYEKYERNWWKEQASARNTLLEISKLVFYLLGGNFKK